MRPRSEWVSVVLSGRSVEAVATEAAVDPASLHPSKPRTSTPQARRIVVVDDEPCMTRMLRRVLMRHGFAVDVYTDPIQALNSLREMAPGTAGMALIDIAMPGMDGVALTRALATVQPGLPVLLMTGAMPRGMPVDLPAPVISKPFTVREQLQCASCSMHWARPKASRTQCRPTTW